MFLTRIKLNTKKRETIKLLSSPQVVHASIEACFSDEDDSRKLWRLDYLKGEPCILLLSENKPMLHSFKEQFGFVETADEIKDYQPLLTFLKEEQTYCFRLTANPVYSIKDASGKRGKVVGHVTIEQQEGWLSKKATEMGVEFGGFRVVGREIKRFKRQNETVTISQASYEGVLRIKNLNLFKEVLTKGLGREKAYGCGLVTLAKL